MNLHKDTQAPPDIWPVLFAYLESHPRWYREPQVKIPYAFVSDILQLQCYMSQESYSRVYSAGIRIFHLKPEEDALQTTRGMLTETFWTEDRAIAFLRSRNGTKP